MGHDKSLARSTSNAPPPPLGEGGATLAHSLAHDGYGARAGGRDDGRSGNDH